MKYLHSKFLNSVRVVQAVNVKILICFLIDFGCLFYLNGYAQVAVPDPTFNPIDVGFGNGDGADHPIRTIVVQPDGKILVGGSFNNFNTDLRACIARLNPDGSIDNSFTARLIASTNFALVITAIAIQSDGKVLIGGNFSSVTGISRNGIARLNADGTLDNTFNPGTGFGGVVNPVVNSISIQSDGEIIVGGRFNSFNGIPQNNIARLNTDGSLDTTFNLGPGANFATTGITIQPDNKIIVVGSFTLFNGVNQNHIARLNPDGSLDTTFDTGIGANNSISNAVVQPDGKIVAVGSFTLFNNTNVNRIVRLNPDGGIDNSFSIGLGANNNITGVSLNPDGTIMVNGNFTSYNGIATNYLARLNSDGTIDGSFNQGTGADNLVYSLASCSDRSIIIGGDFLTFNGNNISMRIARLNNDGSLDLAFNKRTGITGNNALVTDIAIQDDGKVIVVGLFSSYNGLPIQGVVRLNSDGSFDNSFNAGVGASNVSKVSIQPDGKIIIAGSFTSYNGTSINHIARLNPDGTIDTSFNPGAGPGSYHTGIPNSISALTLLPNGKILIGGFFHSYDGVPIDGIARLNADGSLDTSFSLLNSAGMNIIHVDFIALAPDGTILIGGDWTFPPAFTVYTIGRLKSDGNLDTSFNLTQPVSNGIGPDGALKSAVFLADGRIVIGGYFVRYDGITVNYIARLNPDGTLDTSFNSGTGADHPIDKLVSQPDGKYIIGGHFYHYNSVNADGVARLNLDGSLDSSFDSSLGVNGRYVNAIAVQEDGKIILGGYFTSYKGLGKNRIVRIFGDPINQTIAFGTFTQPYIYGDANITLSATGGASGNPVTYASSNTAIAQIVNGNEVKIKGAGIVNITASQSGDNQYNAAADVQQTLTINKAVITVKVGDATKVYGTSNPSFKISYSGFVNGEDASVLISTATPQCSADNTTSVGGIGITASNANAANYDFVYQDGILTITPASQIITFGAIADKNEGGVSFPLNAAVDSNLPVQYSTTAANISIANGQVSILGPGRATVTASQPGDNNHLAATSVAQSFCVIPATPAISIVDNNPSQVVLQSSASGGNQWFHEGVVISGATSQELAITSGGVYSVSVQVDDCSSLMSGAQTLVITGIEPGGDEIQLYPNPAESKLKIELGDEGEPKTISIYDVTGKQLNSLVSTAKDEELDVKDYSEGLYLIHIKKGADVKTVRMVKK